MVQEGGDIRAVLGPGRGDPRPVVVERRIGLFARIEHDAAIDPEVLEVGAAQGPVAVVQPVEGDSARGVAEGAGGRVGHVGAVAGVAAGGEQRPLRSGQDQRRERRLRGGADRRYGAARERECCDEKARPSGHRQKIAF
jgi:hypothetical protein